MALQALDPIQEEEGGRVLWQWRVLRSVLDLGLENGCSTESRQYPSGIHAQKLARQNLIGQGVGSVFRTYWGHSCSDAGARAVAR